MTTASFTIICPTYNRAHALGMALTSLQEQTDPNWTCFVLDDGSTDNTHELIISDITAGDSRFIYQRYEENRGGVAMNEIGMAIAVERGGYWVRLGSDDWFEPEKLELDRHALRDYGACYGPYQNFPAVHKGELNVPGQPRLGLLAGEFAASWANIAMRSEILAAVVERHGMFCDPRLRNMEDWLFNIRAAHFTEIAWRALSEDKSQIIVGATSPELVPFPWRHDAHYRVALDGASAYHVAGKVIESDYKATADVLAEDRAHGYARAEIPAPTVKVFDR